ncbi:MAG TPA: hypothetical protein VER33_09105 [Polyangiaceae bacterium]|nr:hypothetical protein [Polyangiaceae bacterium]
MTTTFEDVPDAVSVVMAVADADGLYWTEDSGALRALGRGATTSVELRPAVTEPITVLGMLTDATTLYWSDAGSNVGGPPSADGPPPPSRLYAAPKTGGTVELVFELETDIMYPLALHAGGVIVRSQGRLHRVSNAGLETLTHIPPSSSEYHQVVDGVAYWLSRNEAAETWVLLAASLDGGPPRIVSALEGASGSPTNFQVTPGRVLWLLQRTQFDPLVSVEKLMMLDLSTGCIQELPSLGESIGQGVLDASHVYWRSFNGLASASPGHQNGALPFVRVNLVTGAFERVVSGFDVTISTDPLAHDEAAIYFRRHLERSLVRVLKPD